MSTKAARLREARTRAGFDHAIDAAIAMGIHQNTYRAHENGQNDYDEKYAVRYAKRFRVPVGWLLFGEPGEIDISPEGQEPSSPAASTEERRPSPNASEPEPVSFSRNRIPVYGVGVGGSDGKFVLNGQRVADVLAPPSLDRVPGAYAIYVHGESMVPRYEPGETVFVDPHKPVRQGDYVVIQIRPDHDGDPPLGFIKRFVSRSDREVVVSQLNPPNGEGDLVRFRSDEVMTIHKIVGMAE